MSGVLVMRGRFDALHHLPCGQRREPGTDQRGQPALACGAYALTASIADGTMDNHTQRHWLHDVAIFELLSTSAIHSLVGLPITFVTAERAVSR
jgi:hypothetical protein